MRLSKLEAAQQQLDLAASLFVNRQNPLAMHTLSGAAEEILGSLANRASEQSMFERMRVAAEQKFGRPVSRNELTALVNKSRNSLKHATDPAEDHFDYEPDEAVAMLFRALVNYQLVMGVLTDPMEKALTILIQEYKSLFPEGRRHGT